MAMDNEELLEILRTDVVEGATRLLGVHLVSGPIRAAIVETEAYRAEDDPASHAFRGPTVRNQVMFEGPGNAYVYFCYGCHWMLNITALVHGQAGGILIRAAQPINGLEIMRERRTSNASRPTSDRNLLSGPGKLAQAFGVNSAMNGQWLFDPESAVRLEVVEGLRPFIASPRVGIAPGKGEQAPWRFSDLERIAWVSAPRPSVD